MFRSGSGRSDRCPAVSGDDVGVAVIVGIDRPQTDDRERSRSGPCPVAEAHIYATVVCGDRIEPAVVIEVRDVDGLAAGAVVLSGAQHLASELERRAGEGGRVRAGSSRTRRIRWRWPRRRGRRDRNRRPRPRGFRGPAGIASGAPNLPSPIPGMTTIGAWSPRAPATRSSTPSRFRSADDDAARRRAAGREGANRPSRTRVDERGDVAGVRPRRGDVGPSVLVEVADGDDVRLRGSLNVPTRESAGTRRREMDRDAGAHAADGDGHDVRTAVDVEVGDCDALRVCQSG